MIFWIVIGNNFVSAHGDFDLDNFADSFSPSGALDENIPVNWLGPVNVENRSDKARDRIFEGWVGDKSNVGCR